MWTKSKKTFAVGCVLAAVAVLSPGAPPGVLRTSVTLMWNYPTNELSTNLLFKIYSTTNATAPFTNWPLYATVTGTNLTATLPIDSSQRFFSMTASNWHGESVPSNVAGIPAPPRSDVNLSIGP